MKTLGNMFRQVILLNFISLFGVYGYYELDTKWFQVPLDHFSFSRSETFKIKYLVNNKTWDVDSGPIFFYTGNEGQVESFAKNTGFMWDIAGEFNALLVFAEHRYYGESMPFGNKSLDVENIGYLTSSQALADYADLITSLQVETKNGPKYPVITFGGSYGGMLSAYFRIKYPHLAIGAIAASAPVHMFPGMAKCEDFYKLTTSSYRVVNSNCSSNIQKSWAVIRNFSKSANESDWLKKTLNLCDPIKNDTDTQTLIDFLGEMYVNMAMVNYPYPCDFLMDLPGQPVRYVCQYLSKQLDGKELIAALGKVLNVYSNYGGKNTCVNYKSTSFGNLDANGWDYQACTEMVMPMCSDGVHDMFEPSPWNYTTYAAECQRKYKVTPRPDMAKVEYGGARLQYASNIVFSNGLKDPWTAGGILNSINESVEAIAIIDAAHHLDLRAANEKDPSTVRMARDIHKQNIRRWIREFTDLKQKGSA